MSDSIHQEVLFDASPNAVYEALLDETQHSAFSGGTSSISREVGGAFSGHDGQIVGRHIELRQDTRIVQAWRVGAWPEGQFTLLRIELKAEGDKTLLVLDHWAVPEEQKPHIAGGWEARYWEPMREYFAKGS